MNRISKQNGIALIQVLLMTAIMSVVAISISISARNQVEIAESFKNKVKAENHLEKVKDRILFNLFAHDSQILHGNTIDGIKWDFSGKQVKIDEKTFFKIKAHTGKVSLSSSSPHYLIQLFIAGGADETLAKELTDAIGDWVDANDDARTNGAEQYQYSNGITVRNAPMQHISELKFIKGMTESIYEKVKEDITLYFTPSMDPRLMSDFLLNALFGATKAQIIRRNQLEGNSLDAISILLNDESGSLLMENPWSVYTVEIVVKEEKVILHEKFDVKMKSQDKREPIVILSRY